MKARINLGPAGNCDKDIISSLNRLKSELNLQSQEVEFTLGVKMKNETAKAVGELRKKLGIELSVHAPYYINLSSEDKAKLKKSFNWVFLSCERGHHMGARKIVLHPGFYLKKNPSRTFDIVLENIKRLQKEIRKRKWNVELAPETTGKLSAFGNLDEIIELTRKAKCSFCVDFAHLYARQQGKINFAEVLDKLKSFNHIHSHFSCIAFTKKGERKHLDISVNKPPFKELAKELLKRKVNITIIAESPRTWRDSLAMKKILGKLGYK
ncbi:MAG: TIM barrel protein [Nanoarchaeota archaeon]|nr:TIM barrel protein [Nanoarchaeota archaeon]